MDNLNQHKLILLEGPSIGRIYTLDQPDLVLGREPGVDILIDSAGVSRRHARIFLQNDLYYIEDLGSSNGTFINGERLSKPRRLKHSDKISLGRSIVLEYQGDEPSVYSTMLEGAPPSVSATNIEGAPASISATAMDGVAPVLGVNQRDFKPPKTGETMIGEEPQLAQMAVAPQLIVAIAGETVNTYTLRLPRLSIGRSEDNQIIIKSQIVSRYHATLERKQGSYVLEPSPDASNPVLLEGRPLASSYLLKHGDILRIGSQTPGMMVTLTYLNPAESAESLTKPIQFGDKTIIQVGRDANNDVVLDSPTVSRFHAQIERIGQRYRVTDLHSGNGTFVNDQRITQPVWLKPDDVIRIGRHSFVVGQESIDQAVETRGVRVEAINLNKWVRKDVNILKNISLIFQPREFIVVVGQSGGGKSTLVDAIAGYRPATHGMVFVNNTNIYQNFDVVRNDVGYVPQKDIIHYELSVYQALEYAAKLRMPRDASQAERHQRIMEVLADLDLTERKDMPIHKLSGGQLKRVSIGVELLTKPGLFFLDEPTSGLDPGTETVFMHLMRRLADQGRTIVMVTHATKNVMLADKVVFLARGGFLTWFGPPEEALQYFDKYRSERERRAREMDFDQIYSILDDSSKGSPKEWAARFLEDAAYQKYIVTPLQGTQSRLGMANLGEAAPREAKSKVKRKQNISAFHQLFVLSARNVKILTRDRVSLLLMLLAPFLIASLDFMLAPAMSGAERAPFSFMTGNGANAAVSLFLVVINSLLISGFSQMREFVKEADIYKRERLVNLKIFPYVFSKIWVAVLLAFYQAAAFTLIHHLAYRMPGGMFEIGLFYITVVLGCLAGMLTGLLASAMSPSASTAPLLMILLVIPQIVLSGALAPIPTNVSSIAASRWTFQGLIGISGMGSDVAADACWQVPKAERSGWSLDTKEQAGCRCMGVAIFTPGSCNFPGLGEFFVEELALPAPQEPAPLEEPDKPVEAAEPVIPAAPEAPADKNDQVAMAQYMTALQTYQDKVANIQDQYKAQMQLYKTQMELYQTQMEDFQTRYQDLMKKFSEDKLTYETARGKAVSQAEGVIDLVSEKYSWAYVNKSDEAGFWQWISIDWGAHLIIIVVYCILILFIIKRKDT